MNTDHSNKIHFIGSKLEDSSILYNLFTPAFRSTKIVVVVSNWYSNFIKLAKECMTTRENELKTKTKPDLVLIPTSVDGSFKLVNCANYNLKQILYAKKQLSLFDFLYYKKILDYTPILNQNFFSSLIITTIFWILIAFNSNAIPVISDSLGIMSFDTDTSFKQFIKSKSNLIDLYEKLDVRPIYIMPTRACGFFNRMNPVMVMQEISVLDYITKLKEKNLISAERATDQLENYSEVLDHSVKFYYSTQYMHNDKLYNFRNKVGNLIKTKKYFSFFGSKEIIEENTEKKITEKVKSKGSDYPQRVGSSWFILFLKTACQAFIYTVIYHTVSEFFSSLLYAFVIKYFYLNIVQKMSLADIGYVMDNSSNYDNYWSGTVILPGAMRVNTANINVNNSQAKLMGSIMHNPYAGLSRSSVRLSGSHEISRIKNSLVRAKIRSTLDYSDFIILGDIHTVIPGGLMVITNQDNKSPKTLSDINLVINSIKSNQFSIKRDQYGTTNVHVSANYAEGEAYYDIISFEKPNNSDTDKSTNTVFYKNQNDRNIELDADSIVKLDSEIPITLDVITNLKYVYSVEKIRNAIINSKKGITNTLFSDKVDDSSINALSLSTRPNFRIPIKLIKINSLVPVIQFIPLIINIDVEESVVNELEVGHNLELLNENDSSKRKFFHRIENVIKDWQNNFSEKKSFSKITVDITNSTLDYLEQANRIYFDEISDEDVIQMLNSYEAMSKTMTPIDEITIAINNAVMNKINRILLEIKESRSLIKLINCSKSQFSQIVKTLELLEYERKYQMHPIYKHDPLNSYFTKNTLIIKED